MNKITKDQAKDLRNAFQCWQQDYDPVEDKEQYDMFGLGMVAMDALLASLEAEAVGEVVLGEYDDCGCHPDARVACIAVDGQADWENFKDGTRLYTAPPAPVAVPDDVMAAMQKVARIRLDLNDFDGDKRGILDCLSDAEEALIEVVNRRAAMLQGADGNSPVTQDGWVACSERMPKKNDKVLIFIDFNSEHVPPSIHDAEFTGATFRRGGATVNVYPLEDGYGVTHWKPLPSPPAK